MSVTSAGAATAGLGRGVAAAWLWLFVTVGDRISRGRKVTGLVSVATVGLTARSTLLRTRIDGGRLYALAPDSETC
jgi:hypothetical protein